MNHLRIQRILIRQSAGRLPAFVFGIGAFLGALWFPTAVGYAQAWTGGGADSNFSTAANWSPVATPVNDGSADLVFSGSTKLSPNVDAAWSVDSIAFSSTAGNFSIGGSPLTIGTEGITDNASKVGNPPSMEAIDISTIQLSASQTWEVTNSSSELFIGAFASNIPNNGNTVTIAGTGEVIVDGTISGSGGITVDSGAIDMGEQSQTFTGALVVNGGFVNIRNAAELGSSAGAIDLNGGLLSFDQAVDGPVTIMRSVNIGTTGGFIAGSGSESPVFASAITGPGTLTLENAGSITLASAANSYSGGTVIKSAATLICTTSSLQGNVTGSSGTLDFNQNFNGTYSGNLTGGPSAAVGLTVVVDGQGIISLSGNNSYFGLTQINGSLKLLGSAALSPNAEVQISSPTGVLNLNNFNATCADLNGPGSILLGSATLTTGGDNASLYYEGSISGTGGFTKVGTGTLTLTGNESFGGVTTVAAGTLNVMGSLANNGSNSVMVNAGTSFNAASIVRTVAVGGSFDNLGSSAAGTTANLLGSSANILAGESHNSDADGIAMEWRVRQGTELPGSAFPALISDVLDLTGMSQSRGSNVETDSFVLEMQYNPSTFNGDENSLAADGQIFLGWLNPTGNSWENATAGDFGSGLAGDVFENVQSSWSKFASENGITDANVGNFLGSYGVDIADHEVWAVVNHNSEFAAVPEPSGILLELIAICVAVGLAFRRSRLPEPVT